MTEWLILVLAAPAILVPVVLLIGFAGCSFHPGVAPGPSAPIIDSLVPKSSNLITVSWEWPSETGVDNYHFERTNPDGSVVAFDKPALPLSFDDMVPGPGTYSYTIQGFLIGGDKSDPSTPRTVTIIGPVIFLGANTGDAGINSLSTAITSAVPGGSVIVVGTMCTDTSVISVSDGINPYTKVNEITNGSTALGLWYTPTVLAAQLASGSMVTTTFAGAVSSEAAMVMCYIIGLANNSIDIFASAPTTATPDQSILTGMLAQVSEIIIGLLASTNQSPSYTPGTGFRSITSIANFGVDQATLDFEYQIVFSTNSVTWNPVASDVLSDQGVIEVASFKGK